LLALKGETTLSDICKLYEVAPTQVKAWKNQLLEQGANLFAKNDKTATDSASKIEREKGKLYEKISQLTVERDFLKEEFYLNEYKGVKELKKAIGAYILY
jgi:transposase